MANSDGIYRRVIEHLGLQKYYPKKLSREEALVVSENVISCDELNDADKIPWYILQNLVMCNYEGRGFDLDENQTFYGMDQSMFLHGCSEEEKTGSSNNDHVSPPDALVALFLCCDDFLRQLLSEKLSTCQLAIPLLLPIFDANHQQQWELIVWGMSTLRKKWKTSSGLSCEKSMAVHQLPIVSALRLGRPQLSKSKLLNCVINEHKHDIFFHSGCKGGHLERKLSKGLLEITWYLPNQKSMNTFPDALTFLNLRGNASEFKYQTDFLSEISLVTIAFLSSDGFKDDDTALLESLYRQNGHLIMVLDGPPGAYLKESLNDMYEKFGRDTVKNIRFISSSNKNELKISGEIWKLVTSNFEGSYGNVVCNRSIEMYTEVAQRMNFHVDELLPECSESKQSVNKLVNILHLNGKENELPLQRITVNIGDKKKEQYRLLRKGNSHTEKYVDKVKTEITDLRRHQLSLHESRKECTYNMFRKSFTTQHLKRKYFFGFVKIMTDRYSIDKLQPIRQEYIEKWNALCDAKKEAKRPKALLESMKKELDELEQKLSRYSLGLEHFNREIGQHYEMASDLKLSDLNEPGNQFAVVAAEMLLHGYPIELMDGDASHVPLTWIEAVLSALKSNVGNKNMFVLSVLGIQSSGKSTMLNAMFGLQFAVSAGRCTKGIFAQLVPVDERLRKDTNFDYILVVDTEGLRAPEFASIQQNSNHDNELATLVIGLGDVTIINIMGENPTDMQDTLQIAVHAFMKMENVNIKPSCIFVHQNVTDVTASDMNTSQKRNMRELLDKITRIAAAEANCSERYQSFSDVINFQENKHIMYVSSLWQGDPPMAPPNPGYSKCILQVKQQVINFMRKSEGKTIDGFKSRLSDLWRAILFQNFVFSFKNSLEIQVFNALDTEYVRHSRTLRRNAMAYSDRLQVECKKVTAEEIKTDGIIEPYTKKLHEDISTFKSNMDEYFSCEVTACQWKGKTEIKMDELCRDILKELKDEFISIRKKIMGRAEIDIDIKRYEKEISRKAEELAEPYRSKELATVNIKSEFAEHWKMWISGIPRCNDYIDVEETFERVVEVSSLVCDREYVSRVFQSDLSNIQVCEDDFNFGKNMFNRLADVFGGCGKSRKTYLDEANWRLQRIREEALKRISIYRRDGRCYSTHLGIELFESLSSEVGAIKVDGKCHLTSNGKIRLTVCNFKWSLLPSLKSMQEQHIRENDLHYYMESQRDRLWQMFRDECNGLQIGTKAASVVSRELDRAIEASLPDQCKLGIIDHLRQPTSRLFANKKSLHSHMLIDMAEKRIFRLFEDYFSDPKQCMDNFIAKHIEAVCFQKDDEGNSVLQEIYCQKTHDQFSIVRKAIDASYRKCDGIYTMKTWWPILLEMIGNNIDVKMDIGFFNEDGNLDLDELRSKVLSELKTSEDNMIKSFNERSFDEVSMRNKCQEFFRKDLLGCRELCPFCKALCDLQTSNAYDGHSTELHRPQGVAGYRWDESRKLTTSVCTTLMSGCSFSNSDTNGEWHSYQDYRNVNEYYKSWDIKPMAGESELYWRWFMVKYNKELAERYKCEQADIPDGWNEISWESVKEDIMTHL